MGIFNPFCAISIISAILGAASAANADGVTSGQSALLVQATQSVRTMEKGVTVYRGTAPHQEPELAGGEPVLATPKSVTIINVYQDRPGRLRTQGFWSGTGPPSKRFTRGFFADRVHAIGSRAQR